MFVSTDLTKQCTFKAEAANVELEPTIFATRPAVVGELCIPLTRIYSFLIVNTADINCCVAAVKRLAVLHFSVIYSF